MQVRELHRPYPMGANTSYQTKGAQIGGFLAKTSGTITIVDNRTTTTIVDAVPVTAGIYTPIPIVLDEGGTVTLGGGASGTLMV